MSVYPAGSLERDQWILQRRPAREALDPYVPYAFCVEEEPSGSGDIALVATIFLTNRECPWRCLMCDLWKNTLTETVPLGAIPAQIDHALARLTPAQHIKLYNSGSFFDPRAIPIPDYPAIARRLTKHSRVIVESHPSLLGDSCLQFRDLLKGRLEVAMGLETVHPEVLARLNKRMTLEQFSAAAAWLNHNSIDLRVFILVKPPFLDEDEALHWAQRSIDFAFDCHASVVALIPTRTGNGALDDLAATGEFSPPKLKTLEAAAEYGVSLQRGRVFADLWDLERFSSCSACYQPRHHRLHQMNLTQSVPPAIHCPVCGVE
jgi:radical SAM enzyme (TIGR01210 family)